MSRLTDCQIRALLPGMKARAERLKSVAPGQAGRAFDRVAEYERELEQRGAGLRTQEPQADRRKA